MQPDRWEGFFECGVCEGILRDQNDYLSAEDEKARYQDHNNDVNDPGYQKFVSPITDAVLEAFGQDAVGLDFGCGTGPVVSKVLNDKGYELVAYDPFFCNKPKTLERQYDYIVCCEVAEHFHDPHKEFELLRKLLKPGGKLYCMTHLYTKDIDFENWYYRNDPTHVFFYRAETFEWIKEHIGFSDFRVEGRLVELGR